MELKIRNTCKSTYFVEIEADKTRGVIAIFADTQETTENIAKLIAAAPDLLELLKDTLTWDGILPHSKTRIEQAIAKATN